RQEASTSRVSPSELTNSVTASPQPPRLRTRVRNARSVTPSIGARTMGGSRVTGPTEIGLFIVLLYVLCNVANHSFLVRTAPICARRSASAYNIPTTPWRAFLEGRLRSMVKSGGGGFGQRGVLDPHGKFLTLRAWGSQ